MIVACPGCVCAYCSSELLLKACPRCLSRVFHGTFFDVGELPAIIDFVMQGGLEQAAKKDLEREKLRVQAMASASASLRIEVQHEYRRGTAIVDLLSAQFG